VFVASDHHREEVARKRPSCYLTSQAISGRC
jgi:hypothetical protein